MKMHKHPQGETRTVQLEVSKNELEVIASGLLLYKEQRRGVQGRFGLTAAEQAQLRNVAVMFSEVAKGLSPEPEWAAGTEWDWMALKQGESEKLEESEYDAD